ncbi:MAG: ATP-binding protein [Anaerolineae bacterium]|nr:ATP-binding protein [Anaerolineae bacterium]MDQ7035447.1 ATP-binding protein [Anaerolineae bacterium]
MAETVANSASAYEFLVRTTNNALLIADTSLQITHVNPAAAAMLGVTPEQVVGKTPKQVFSKNHALINLFIRDGEQKLDVRLPRQRLAQGIAETLDTGERVILLQDVTETRDIENRRAMLSKAIAHDLRNPISAIGGFADLVTRFGDLNDLQTRYLLRIKQTTTKLHDMVKSLVDLAWIEAGMPLAHVPIRLDELIQKAVKELSITAQKNRVGIAVSLQKPLPIVMGDPVRLQLVVFNILQNAIIYSAPESNVAIHGWGDENEIYCSIADRGFGIIDTELELVFDRMYRSRDERVTDIHGGGIGLTVAKTILKRHGGDLWASSNIDEGSTFTFVLPAVEL